MRCFSGSCSPSRTWETTCRRTGRCSHGRRPGRGPRAGAVSIEEPPADETPDTLCRAKRSTRPLDRTAEQLQTLIAAAVEG
ncbi:hypothetical protein [Streptomyces sp. NBC_00572]|uniref:hypothetical protein n=1 Tax=Streptomyces sp. NBC_00572 TaxID=2903664 RepID=UPI00224D590C|nr:hypothetical protein [Streptomyces sp. NBC_00572]MCX4980799.1 hypothetical protein [Streptomyces sp. NBC_00572]